MTALFTEKELMINPDPCGEAAVRQNWERVRRLFLQVESGGGSEFLWGYTQANWVNVADPYVSIKSVPSRTSSVVSGAAFNCYLSRSRPGDPNVRSGTNIAYMLDANGDAHAVGDYMDDKIGMVKKWYLSIAAIPAGWALMNGVANAAGSGVDMSDKFVRGVGSTALLATGGADTHTHTVGGGGDVTVTISGSTGTWTTGITVNPAYTGIEVRAHPPHGHDSTDTVIQAVTNADPPIFLDGTPSYTEVRAWFSEFCTNNTHVAAIGNSCTSTEMDWGHYVVDLGHYHTINDSGHFHNFEATATIPASSFSVSTASNVPVHIGLYFIERLN